MILGAIILVVVGLLYYFNTRVKLSSEDKRLIKGVLSSDPPELVEGTTGFAKSGDLDIWYEVINPTADIKGTVLLVMGHSSTAMLWTADFYQVFVDKGYQVIRYDNRDVGMSSWITDWNRKNPYTLEDMTKDGIAVLDAVGVNKAHVIGVSMGAMMAQRMTISHRERVLSLTSAMSSGFMMDPDVAPVPKSIQQDLIILGLKYLVVGTESRYVKFFVSLQQSLMGNGPYKVEAKRSAEVMFYELRKRKGFNKRAIRQQARAMEASGSRLVELSSITTPTLVIHGASDPLINVEHAHKYAPLIPDAQTLFIEGMGHDIPMIYLEQVHQAIFKNFERA